MDKSLLPKSYPRGIVRMPPTHSPELTATPRLGAVSPEITRLVNEAAAERDKQRELARLAPKTGLDKIREEQREQEADRLRKLPEVMREYEQLRQFARVVEAVASTRRIPTDLTRVEQAGTRRVKQPQWEIGKLFGISPKFVDIPTPERALESGWMMRRSMIGLPGDEFVETGPEDIDGNGTLSGYRIYSWHGYAINRAGAIVEFRTAGLEDGPPTTAKCSTFEQIKPDKLHDFNVDSIRRGLVGFVVDNCLEAYVSQPSY